MWALRDFYSKDVSFLSCNLGVFMYCRSQMLGFVGTAGPKPGESLVGARSALAPPLRNLNSSSSPFVRPLILLLGTA